MPRLAALAALGLAAGLQAAEPIACFEDAALEARYRDLVQTIRCMKCQNQSIAESPIDQAQDIKQQVCELMRDEGMSDTEIRSWLAARYGDFINYMPPLKPTTWLLWAAPVLFLAGGGIVLVRVLRVRALQPLDADEDEDIEG